MNCNLFAGCFYTKNPMVNRDRTLSCVRFQFDHELRLSGMLITIFVPHAVIESNLLLFLSHPLKPNSSQNSPKTSKKVYCAQH